MPLTTAAQSNLVATTYAALIAAVSAANPLRSQTYATIFNIANLCGAFNSALAAYIVPLSESAASPSDLALLVAAQSTLATFTQFQTSILTLLGSGQNRPIVINSATNLLMIASQYYPQYDPVETAIALCQANGLTSFFITVTPTSIILPTIFGSNVFGVNTQATAPLAT
jgi:hypothetical protein